MQTLATESLLVNNANIGHRIIIG